MFHFAALSVADRKHVVYLPLCFMLFASMASVAGGTGK